MAGTFRSPRQHLPHAIIPSVIKHDRWAFNRHAALSPHKRRRAVALASGHYESIIMAAGISCGFSIARPAEACHNP